MSTTFYVLRHKVTGCLMPAQMTRSSRGGWSYWEPSDRYSRGYQPEVPRLFPTLRGAQNARIAWALGRHSSDLRTTSFGFDDPPETELSINISPAGRTKADLEILVITMGETYPIPVRLATFIAEGL